MLKHFSLFLIFCTTNIFAEIYLSSPEIKLNAQNQRVIELKIQNANVKDGDIILKEYKTDEIIDEIDFDYTLINNFDNYQKFVIVLSKDYQKDYFSFRILIKNTFSKDIFIFLPSNIRNYSQKNKDQKIFEATQPKTIESNNQYRALSNIQPEPLNSYQEIITTPNCCYF